MQLGLQYLGVDEEADQPLGFQAIAVGDRHPDTDRGLAAVAKQQGLERGEQQHEQGHVLTLGEGLEFGDQRGVQMQLSARAAMALQRRTRVVQGQLQQRMFAAQAGAPIIELALFLPGGHPLTLPQGIVGIVQRQRRQRRLALIQGQQFVDHHLHRPTIGDDVVLGDYQHVVLRFDVQQRDAHQRAVD